ncbi:MAG: bacteriorhodopsin-like [Anaerolineae bacterium]
MTLPETLTLGQYQLAYNIFSFTIAAMLGSFVFFVLSRQNLAPRYRGAMVLSALVVGIAGYHYLRIFTNWADLYAISGGTATLVEGAFFNDAYRYVDWALTVPLLVAELVNVLGLPKKQSGWLTFRLAFAALAMVILGYPGEVAATIPGRLVWGTLSTIPFVYIVYVLFSELGDAIDRQPGEAKVLVRNTRLLLLATWGFYPIVYLLPVFGIGSDAFVGVQVGYAIADVLAKCGYGFVIYNIARVKTEALAETGTTLPEAVPAAGD